MNIRECYGCPFRRKPDAEKLDPITDKTRCEIATNLLKVVRPLKLSSVSFHCPKKRDAFQPGYGVKFTVDVEDGGERCWPTECEGHIIGWVGYRLRIVSKETDSALIRLLPCNVKLTGENRRVCKHCGLPEGYTGIAIKDREWVCRVKFPDVDKPQAQPFEEWHEAGGMFAECIPSGVALACEYEVSE